MMHLYMRPLRVYVILGVLALWGVLSGFQLPISLFPNSNQVRISINVPLGSLSSQQFYETYGRQFESRLQRLNIDSYRMKEVRAEYRNQKANYQLLFEWGTDPDQSMSEVQTLVNTHFANTPEEVRRSIEVYVWSENSGFLAVSMYSPMRSLDELYQILNPMIEPMKSFVVDAEDITLYNPNEKEITVTVSPERLAQYEITTLQAQKAIQTAVVGLNGGTFKMGEKSYLIDLPKNVDSIEMLSHVRVSERGRAPIFLKDIAKITSGVSKDSQRKFKTSGVESLVLFANPKQGGNIKNMADQVVNQLKILEKQWPSDVQYKILVNPSEFINKSVLSVVKEVFLAAFLAVVVLFIFIGSFKNVVTAAIEIPLSLLMAFILMRLTGMNLNMISLGGLALSAGMNVDASVVVLENIFRHFEGKKADGLTYMQKAQVVMQAVNEVKMPIIASTVASLVVFFPLIFTKGLTHSLLGDLAKAVIFSHGLSAVVALILVPTIRLHLIARGHQLEAHSPFEKYLTRLETFYRRCLEKFLDNRRSQVIVFGGVIALLPLLIFLVLPRLDKEVIGKPESDWLIIGVSSPTFTSNKQVEAELESIETTLKEKYGEEISYTFTQVKGTSHGNIMVRIKNKRDIERMVSQAEDLFKNTATVSFWVDQWNPSELEIPDPPHYRIELNGGDPVRRLQVAQDLQTLFLEKGIFDKSWVLPTAEREKEIRVLQFLNSGAESEVLTKQELSHYLRVAAQGVYTERLFQQQQEYPIYLRLNSDNITSLDHLRALPIGFEGKLVPLSALAKITMEDRIPRLYYENQQPLIVVTGRVNKSQMDSLSDKKEQARSAVAEFKSKMDINDKDLPILMDVQPDKDLQESLTHLKWAIAISIFLVFITMVIQLGEIVPSLLVLVAIPLGFIGVLISLFVFDSTLSLNSGLGTILLNGIAVANSIILVDFIRKLYEDGKSARSATVEASIARMRPILMTSLTTVLGMLPIALGLGEGGKILQPLGIAVCGGLWVSMLLTLFIVPALQYWYLSSKESRL